MTMTDPVADMLTRLRNANSAHHDSVSLPSSKLKTHIAEILQQEGYISGWEVSDARVGQTLTLTLKYGPNRERSIAGIKRVSKPGLRVYARPRSPRFSAAWASRSCPPPPVFSPTARQSRRAWVGKSSPTCGDLTCRVLDVFPSTSPPA
jgi:ribosomal protein S8